jgi:hypothetical protein
MAERTDPPAFQYPVQEILDLHTFSPSEAASLIDDYLQAAADKGYSEVVIVHGKGTGKLRRRVHGVLSTHPMVAGFREAEPWRGGWGATVVAIAMPEEAGAGGGGSKGAVGPRRGKRLPLRIRSAQWALGAAAGAALGWLLWHALG